jgi:hypothetical protein
MGVAHMTRDVEIRLIGHPTADGQMLAADAVSLITAFKDITYRLTRSVAERPGLGQADSVLEKLATVRVALQAGSTRVIFASGDETALVDPLAEQVDEAFRSIVDGMNSNERPSVLSDTVADGVDSLISALTKAAPQVELKVPGHQPRLLTMARVSRVPWQRRLAEAAHSAVLHGVLEMVDLRTARFRVRDAAGNGIELIDVMDARTTASMVGESVRVEGTLVPGQRGSRHRMTDPRITLAKATAPRFGLAPTPSVSELIAQAKSAPVPPPLNLTDEELDDLLASTRGE